MGLVPGIHKFSKNLTIFPQILGTRRGHKTSHIIRTHNYGVTWEHHCYVMLPAQCKWRDTICRIRKKTAIIILKISCNTIQHSVVGKPGPWDLCTSALCSYKILPVYVGKDTKKKKKRSLTLFSKLTKHWVSRKLVQWFWSCYMQTAERTDRRSGGTWTLL
jgi:hypothetical protein